MSHSYFQPKKPAKWTFLAEVQALLSFHSQPTSHRDITFYAEDATSWVHFEPIISRLLKKPNRTLSYLTSSWNDPILKAPPPGVFPFCIGSGLIQIIALMTLKAKVCVMTMPDLESFHLKRSRLANVHYTYVFHSMVSTHMIYRKHAFNHFDSILCVGPHQVREIRAWEEKYNLKPKTLFEHGYGRLDSILDKQQPALAKHSTLNVLIAPSYGPNALVETCGEQLVSVLLEAGFRVILRPHPRTLRDNRKQIDAIENKHRNNARFELEVDVSSQESLQQSDILISDWSGAALEYAFGLERPVLFVDVPKKINNPSYTDIATEPIEISIRTRIGDVLSPQAIGEAPTRIKNLCEQSQAMKEKLSRLRETTIFHVGKSGDVGADIVDSLARSISQR